MFQFAIRRILQAVPTLLAVVSLVFFVIRIVPGDPAQAILGDFASTQALQSLREQMGLDRPLWIQYLSFLWNTLRGDLGKSLLNNAPVTEQVLAVMPYTIDLTIGGVLVGVILGLPTGILTALRRNSWLDYLGRTISLTGLSVPSFYLGILLLILFSLKLDWFPMIGGGELDQWGSRLHHLVLPSLSLGLVMAAYITRVTRSSVLEVLNEDYVRTARAKGLSEQIVVYKHALRNALIPIVTVIGIYIGVLLGGAVLVEVIFTRPGLGKILVGAMKQRDYTTLQSTVLIFAGIVILVNLLVDLLYGFLDPRIQYK